MKTYKTWEVIKLLTENEELKFNLTNGPHITISMSDNNYIMLNGSNGRKISADGNISINDTWELEQQPVNFMEAVNSGKRIKCESLKDFHDIEWCFNTRLSLKVINERWYIEEEYENE